uniref:Uncharacterized protein n=1 Tax=Mycena chlorophos TaxID=658473 RepID=A0ABQ0L511_MYCCL|nr:predicted protein [Mycena chlorophos]
MPFPSYSIYKAHFRVDPRLDDPAQRILPPPMNQLYYRSPPLSRIASSSNTGSTQCVRCILFPADANRQPSVVQMMTSPMAFTAQTGPRMPHPEVHMDSIAPVVAGGRAWDYHIYESLEGVSRHLSQPYIFFFPILSQDGLPFPVNGSIRDIQGHGFTEHNAWRGNIVVGKFTDRNAPFESFMDAGLADLSIIRNLIRSQGSPRPLGGLYS